MGVRGKSGRSDKEVVQGKWKGERYGYNMTENKCQEEQEEASTEIEQIKGMEGTEIK